jgi:periodic tryptophan protein 2
MLVAGLSNGLLDMYQLPGFEPVHVLSVSRERISCCAFNATGDWIAGASAPSSSSSSSSV